MRSLPLVPDADGRLHFHAVLHALIDKVRREGEGRVRCRGTLAMPTRSPPPHTHTGL